jgi:hypothetical protein
MTSFEIFWITVQTYFSIWITLRPMPNRIRLLPECHADTALVAFLVDFDENLYRHTNGSEVASDMKAAAKGFTVVAGITDTDAITPRYFDSFKLILEENKVCFMRRPNSGEYWIRNVFGGVEAFILWNAEQVGVNLTEYGFADTVKGLRPRFKKPAIETDPDYLRLLQDLYARQAPGLLTLKRLLQDLIAAA